jgi:hypothetical protein
MPDPTARNRMREKQQIPRIDRRKAAQIFARLEQLTENPEKLTWRGFGQFLGELEEPILQLAIQPDSWGERTRARLVSFIMDIRGIPADPANVAEIVDISNVIMPCFLLELGRRKQNIAVEFPLDPWDPAACFKLSVSVSHPMHSVSSEKIARLVTEVGERLVGLCYFGDSKCRDRLEAELSRDDDASTSKTRPCRTVTAPSSSKPKA